MRLVLHRKRDRGFALLVGWVFNELVAMRGRRKGRKESDRVVRRDGWMDRSLCFLCFVLACPTRSIGLECCSPAD